MSDLDDDLVVPRPRLDFEDQRTRSAVAERLFGVARPTRIDRFTVGQRLGAGTHGVVYAAHDPRLDRPVALKVLALDEHRDHDDDDLVLGEARAAARLEHPAVVAVYDAGVAEDRLWIAMERIDGVSLRRFVDETRPPWPRLVELFAQVAEGLHAAHEVGLVHRDFKPDNVLVVHDAHSVRGRIVDFGLAIDHARAPAAPTGTSLEATDGGSDSSTTRQLAGTPAYMAPEQASGQRVGPTADQFSFFVSLFEALHGQRPFEGATLPEIQDAIERGAIRPGTRRLPRWLSRTIRRGLARDPSARWPDMGTVARALRMGLVRRGRLPWVLGAGGLALVAGVMLGQARPPDPCRGADAAADQAWSDDVQRALDARLTAVAPARDPQFVARTHDGIDDWFRAWRDGRVEACRAGSRGALTDAQLRVRVECYGDRLAAMEGLLSAIEQQSDDPLAAARIVDALDRLPARSDCDDPEILRRREAWEAASPDDAPARAEVRHELSRIQGALTLPLDATTATALDEAVARAEALGYRPLQALAARLAAGHAQQQGDYPAAVRHARRSLGHAIAGRDDLGAAEAALHLMWVTGELQRDPEQASQHAELADALILALGDPASARVRWLDFQGVIDLAAGDAPRARERFEAALTLRASDPELLATAYRTRLNLATAEADHPERALAITEQALAEIRVHFGPAHPNVALALSNIGSYLDRLGRDAEAREALEAALDLKTALFGPEHPALASTLSNLGALQQPAEAAQTYRRALAILEPVVGPRSPRLANTVFNLGNALHRLERHAEARAQYERYVEILNAAHGDGHGGLLAGRAAIAAELVHDGQIVEGRARLEALVGALRPDGPEPEIDRVDAWSQLARARQADADAAGARQAARVVADKCAALPGFPDCVADDVRPLTKD